MVAEAFKARVTVETVGDAIPLAAVSVRIGGGEERGGLLDGVLRVVEHIGCAVAGSIGARHLLVEAYLCEVGCGCLVQSEQCAGMLGTLAVTGVIALVESSRALVHTD